MLARGSGARIAADGKENGLPGDIIAVAGSAVFGLPHLLVECGGVGKRLGTAFRELQREPLPGGFVPFVATVVNRKWKYYVSPDDRFESLEDALASLRVAPWGAECDRAAKGSGA